MRVVYQRAADEIVGEPAHLTWLWRVFAIWSIDFVIAEAIVIVHVPLVFNSLVGSTLYLGRYVYCLRLPHQHCMI